MMEHVSSDFIQMCLPPFYVVGSDQCVCEWRVARDRGVEWSIFGVFRVFGGLHIFGSEVFALPSMLYTFVDL
jgi:hypothetical protein